jgi:hypothetical protein
MRKSNVRLPGEFGDALADLLRVPPEPKATPKRRVAKQTAKKAKKRRASKKR